MSTSTTNKAKLIWITPEAEQVIGYCARVSNPANQNNKKVDKLLQYCMKHGHWSIFEMASMCVEIETTRDISTQILRHRSFSFQEFSQRYAEATDIDISHGRRQDTKNRQNSIDDLSVVRQQQFKNMQKYIYTQCLNNYNAMLKLGIAKECARKVLPMNTKTKLYMTGSIRSWIHYFNLRCAVETQLEHREIADEIRGIFTEELPIIGGLIK